MAPSIPVLKDMSMQYEYDWGYDCFSEDSKIQFSVAVHDAATVSVLVSDPYYYCYDDSFFAIYEVQLPVENDSIYKYETLTDWGTIYKIYARNFFGYSYCDSIIFTTDLITDPQITERLNQLKNEETDIDVIPTDISDIQIVAKNQVFIPSDYAVRVTNRSGNLQKKRMDFKKKSKRLLTLSAIVFILVKKFDVG